MQSNPTHYQHTIHTTLGPAVRQSDTFPAIDVLHVITGLGVGGAESMLTSLLLSGAGGTSRSNQAVVSLSPGGPNARRLREAGIQVTELHMSPLLPSAWELFRLARLIWLRRPAVVQSWMYHADLAATLALYWSGLRQHTRFYWGLRCSDMDLKYYGSRLRMVIRCCAALSGLPDAIVSNSTAGVEIHRKLGYRSRRILTIDNGIDTERFRPDPSLRAVVRKELGIPDDQPLLAHVARLDPMKDHGCFLRALDRLPGTAALVIGQGTENLPDRTGLYRLGRRNDVSRLLNAADLIVSSSAFGEGFSNAISEGMATGLPAVATNVGDSRRIVGETGLIVPPSDANALAEAISTILAEGTEARRTRGAAARTRIEEYFALARAKQAFMQLYAER